VDWRWCPGIPVIARSFAYIRKYERNFDHPRIMRVCAKGNLVIKNREHTHQVIWLYVLESIGFPPREDLRSDPDVWTPVSDCLRAALALAVIGDFTSLMFSPIIGDLSSIEFCGFL